jgi:menaquinone-dependent protoporphyrinogen oxidase
MNILVTAASKHGATAEIAEIVAGTLREAGHDVDSCAIEEAAALSTVAGYDAVVLGSAVYAGRWLGPARDFVDRHATELAGRPVWLFSSGPIGDPPLPKEEAPEALAFAARIGAREHRSFAGRLDRDQLGMMERAVTKVLRAPDGDFRNVEEIRGWAASIAAAISREEIPA